MARLGASSLDSVEEEGKFILEKGGIGGAGLGRTVMASLFSAAFCTDFIYCL